MKIGTQLLIAALAISFIPVAIIGTVALVNGRHALSNQAFSQLNSIRQVKKAQLDEFFFEQQSDMNVLLNMVALFRQNAYQKLQAVQNHKKAQLEWYFKERLNDIRVLSKSHAVSEALAQFHEGFHAQNQQTSGVAWQAIEEKFGVELKQYQEGHGYHDLVLIGKDGDIVYTAAKRSDLGQNLLNDALKDSPLSKAFQKCQKSRVEITIHDFEPYAPANNQYLAFITAPIFRSGKLIGVLALSLSHDFINTTAQRREGMGLPYETYLVGQLNGQTSYRSNRIINEKAQQVIGYPKSGEYLNKALAGQSGIAFKVGSTGKLAIDAYAPLQIPGLKWCIITTIALEELLTPKWVGQNDDFFSQYLRQNDYYDLFLIHPQGEIFYSVKHEADYGTNLLSGEYADSQLSKLVQEVLQSKTFAMSDFAPYAPSNNKPSAFIAQPLLHNDEIELIVALQLDDTTINQIMQQRAGMGNSGETYLVGSDKLMRSNSYLAPKTHSIEASFADPANGTVNTESSRAALAGETGQKMSRNYLGNLVLSAYTPVVVGDKQWALIAEIKQTEALAPIKTLELWTILVVVFGIPMMIGIAWWLTRRISQPLNQIVGIVNQLANGTLTCWIGSTSNDKNASLGKNKDEISLMLCATVEMSETLQRVILDIQKTVLAAKRGDLTPRVETQSLKGFMKELGENTNQLVATTSYVMEDITNVMTALAQGCLRERTKDDYEGIYAEVSTLVQKTIENLEKIINDIQIVVDNASRGELDNLINLYDKQGFSKDLSHAVNALVEIQKNFNNDIGMLLKNLKNGDLTQPIQTEYAGEFDKIKQNANSTIEKLVSMLFNISQIADAVKNTASKMEMGNNSLSSRTETQAASLEETAAAMEQLTATVAQNAHHAQTANQLVLSAAEVAQNGGLVVRESVDTMQQVYESSNQMLDIINVINGIAFQTKILALNAAVEAAHAGEHGRGFAVVAAEVRNLAQRCAEAAQEIRALLEDSVSNIETGTILVEQAGESMNDIITSIGRVTDIISEVSAASSEQSQGIKQINVAITQMDSMTQQNAALVEQAAANAEGLAQQAAKLADAFGQFKFN
jgi:methyl-accepting chemotaxis protein